MKQLLKIIGSIFVLVVLSAGIWLWSQFLRQPAINFLPLSDNLVSNDSVEGKNLLSNSRSKADYEILLNNFESQSRPAFCGVASSVIMLNASGKLPERITQSTFFTNDLDGLRSSMEISFHGMTLDQLGDLLALHGMEATVFHASNTTIDAFRSLVKNNLETRGDFVLVNYQRSLLEQKSSGHISPLAAYNEDTDKVLVLDVAAHKYPPVWVSVQMLWDAINTMDDSSGKTRGFLLVR